MSNPGRNYFNSHSRYAPRPEEEAISGPGTLYDSLWEFCRVIPLAPEHRLDGAHRVSRIG